MNENKKDNAEFNTDMTQNKNFGERDIFERTAQYDPLKKENNNPIEQPINESANNNGEKMGADIKIKSPFMKKIENFFYHYKWHTIIAAFFVFFIGFCVFQTCTRTTYDTYILYAGGKDLRTIEEGESQTTFEILYSAFGRFVPDEDNDGEKNASFKDIYLPSDDEIRALEESGIGVSHSLLKENDELFRNNMLSGDYYICLLSKELFNEWTKSEDNNPFVPIKSYLPENAKISNAANEDGYLLAGEYGVYLSSTPTYDNPGFKYLPEDTIVCLRKYSSAASPGKRGKNIYETAEKVFRSILSDKSYE